MRRVARGLGKLSRRSRGERRALFRALGMLMLIRISLSALPFGVVLRIVRRLSHVRSASGQRGDPPLTLWAVKAVGRRLLRRNPCLTEALAALVLLTRDGHPARLRIGVAKPESSRLSAHAWLESEGQVVIGEAGPSMGYAPLFSLES